LKVYEGSVLRNSTELIGFNYDLEFTSYLNNPIYLVLNQESQEGIIADKIYNLQGLGCNQYISDFDLEFK
jgi:hypothetical protein